MGTASVEPGLVSGQVTDPIASPFLCQTVLHCKITCVCKNITLSGQHFVEIELWTLSTKESYN